MPDYLAALTGDVRGLRVGVPREYFVEGMQPEVETAVRAAIALLAGLGAEIVDVSLPHTEYALPVYYLIAPAEASANLARYDGVRYGLRSASRRPSRPVGRLPADARAGLRPRGQAAHHAGHLRPVGRLLRRLLPQGPEGAHPHQAAISSRPCSRCDVLVAPTSPTTAFKIGEKAGDPLQMYLADVFTLALNLAGLCGISLPCGFDRAGLPIGLQIMGRAFDEATVLRVAHAYEQATDWHTQRPVLN